MCSMTGRRSPNCCNVPRLAARFGQRRTQRSQKLAARLSFLLRAQSRRLSMTTGGHPMNIVRARGAVLGALALLAAGAAPIRKEVDKAALAPLPKAGEVQSLSAHPTTVRLKGADSSQQLIIAAALKDGRAQDLTQNVEYNVADPKVVKVTTTGRDLPLANGTTKITAVYGDKRRDTSVTTPSCAADLPITFSNPLRPHLAQS